MISDRTISSIFMLPTLKIDGEQLKKHGFLNAYIKDVNCSIEYTNCLFLLFKPPNIDNFNHFVEEEYHRTSDIIDDYDYEEGYTILVYRLNRSFDEDFEKIKKGQYSKTSKDFQNQFKKVNKIMVNGLHRDEITLQHRVFRKSDDLRDYWEKRTDTNFKDDWEVWKTWEEHKETLDIKLIENERKDNKPK